MDEVHLIKENLASVNLQIELSHHNRLQTNAPSTKPLLVAVSKIKPIAAILEAYSCGQRHFGENYIQELIEKATDKRILENCPDIKWHLIGRLHRRKIKSLLGIPNLYMIQSVHSMDYARILNKTWESIQKQNGRKLNVLVQVNTSGEEQKNGVALSAMLDLYRFILEKCPNLKLQGVMTIGKYYHDYSAGPNLDLIALIECRAKICTTFGLRESDVEVSMGMSNDYILAVEMGSTIVRVGQAIFGERQSNRKTVSDSVHV